MRAHGPAWRRAQAGHLSLNQLKVMRAIEQCRTAVLGGHVLRCDTCETTQISYNSCRNRHCPKCQGAAAQRWLEQRQSELLPVEYYHVVFTLPASIADIAYQNKAVVYQLLFQASADTLTTIAADPKHLGARIGFIGDDPSSAHPLYCARRGLVPRRHALESVSTGLLPTGAGAITLFSARFPPTPQARISRRKTPVHRATRGAARCSSVR